MAYRVRHSRTSARFTIVILLVTGTTRWFPKTFGRSFVCAPVQVPRGSRRERSMRPWVESEMHRGAVRRHEDCVTQSVPGLTPTAVCAIQAAFRAKAMDALAADNLRLGQELELISALDIQTVAWAEIPIHLKEAWDLPNADKGIDSLSLNLSVAVQAKDYTNSCVPLGELTNFHYWCTTGLLKERVSKRVVATSATTRLPREWARADAEHRLYTADEREAWRRRAAATYAPRQPPAVTPHALTRLWPHQCDCVGKCSAFLIKPDLRDYFVRIATGAGKSVIMAALLDQVVPGKRAVVVVPKLDLMEQMANLLERSGLAVSRVGTGHQPKYDAHLFVCVCNSAWRLAKVSFDVALFDESHHYEPAETAEVVPGSHRQVVLSLRATKRIFFSATLRHEPDFDFGMRQAIAANVIADYSIVVPFVSHGDHRPSLVDLIVNLPTARKILAFCNSVEEAKRFTRMFSRRGIRAGHYNAHTRRAQRTKILQDFERGAARGGLRVLVTVDVLSEGVDIPIADTCLFVSPRQGIRLRQCVGRVLRLHPMKVDALIIAPPIVEMENYSVEEDPNLLQLFQELAEDDPVLFDAFGRPTNRVRFADCRLQWVDRSSRRIEDVAKLLLLRVYNRTHSSALYNMSWCRAYESLCTYVKTMGHASVPRAYVQSDGFKLGTWVTTQRHMRKSGSLSSAREKRLIDAGFVWDPLEYRWEEGFRSLVQYKEEHGDASVPQAYIQSDGFKLGWWVTTQRHMRKSGSLSSAREKRLTDAGFVWDPLEYKREDGFRSVVQFS